MRIRTILSTGLAATVAAIGLGSIATAANAAVTYDDASVGSVGKGDVQTALGGINDATLQSMWKDGKIKFTSKYQMDSTDVWSCSGGTQQRTSRVMQSRVLNVTAATNAHGKVTSGWTLNGINENVGGSYLGGERFGAPYVGYCPAGQAWGGFLPHVFNNTVVPGVMVNGTELPNTPVEVPAV